MLHAVSPLDGALVHLRAATRDDVPALARIRATPEVYRYWRGGDDLVAAVEEDFAEPETTAYVIEVDGAVVGWIQWQAEEEPDYRHASIDVYVDPACHGRGVGTDAVRTLAQHLFSRMVTTASRSIPRPTTWPRSGRTPRSGSGRSASPGVRSAAPTAPGTTAC